jgi:plasmid stabilization system protein ParE
MAATVIWSQEVLDDIEAIATYIGRDSVFHA